MRFGSLIWYQIQITSLDAGEQQNEYTLLVVIVYQKEQSIAAFERRCSAIGPWQLDELVKMDNNVLLSSSAPFQEDHPANVTNKHIHMMNGEGQ